MSGQVRNTSQLSKSNTTDGTKEEAEYLKNENLGEIIIGILKEILEDVILIYKNRMPRERDQET